jgi:hypothetical protein
MDEEVVVSPVEEVKKLFLGNLVVEEIVAVGDDKFNAVLTDGTVKTFHNDYRELIITDEAIGLSEFMQRKANVITKPFLDLLRKYEYPINDIKFAIDVISNILKENEYRAYQKVYGCKPEEITLNQFDDILR